MIQSPYWLSMQVRANVRKHSSRPFASAAAHGRRCAVSARTRRSGVSAARWSVPHLALGAATFWGIAIERRPASARPGTRVSQTSGQERSTSSACVRLVILALGALFAKRLALRIVKTLSPKEIALVQGTATNASLVGMLRIVAWSVRKHVKSV